MRSIIIGAVVFVASCSPLRSNDAVPAKIGEACAALEECGASLVCNAEALCAPVGDQGTAARNDPCAGDDDCRLGLVCGGAGRCSRGRKGEVADPCTGAASCGDGLACNRDGRCARAGEPGTGLEEDACEATAECGFGLVCSVNDVCEPVPIWSGVDCDIAEGAPRLLFEVPRGGRTTDFFRLPYPNDVLRTGPVAVDRAGYPGLEQFPEPGETVGAVLSALTVNGSGFSLNPAITFRFSRSLDFESLEFGGMTPNFVFVDVTPDSETRGRRPRARFFATTDRARYICQNWLSIRSSEGTPLAPGHTYAVFFRKGLLDTAGQVMEADADFEAIMGDTRPQFPALATAWERYQPFKSWLADEGIPVEDIVGAAVFTTGRPLAPMRAMRPAVYEAAEPELVRAASCDGARSPCAGQPGRGCGPRDEAFAEVHAVVELASFLEGVPPYEDSGGTIAFEEGRPRLQRREETCLAVTVPRRQRPPRGWPLVIFAHHTGDTFRSFVDRGFARSLAQQGWAVASFDGVLQGGRSGMVLHPDAAALEARLDDPALPGLMRDHALQATADLHSITRLAQSIQRQVGNIDLDFDPEHLVFVGHGRGGEQGVAFAAFEPNIQAVVLAGAGGSVLDQIQHTLTPFNHGARAGVMLAEPHLNGMHPGLHLFQNWLDTRDPMNYGVLLRAPPEEFNAKHVFMVQGVDDDITPHRTVNALATSMRLNRVGPELEKLEAVLPVEGGTARGNVRINGAKVTQVIKQYRPTRGGGHDVLFTHPEASTDLRTFLRDLLDDAEQIPTVAP